MTDDVPILCDWTGEAMVPRGSYWAKRADQQWVVGERYLCEIQHERSAASHRHYFAALNEAFLSLSDEQTERLGSVEALRKYALVQAGFRDERSVVCSSKAEALRVAAFVRPIDQYAVVSVAGTAVVVLTAKSQSMRAMGKREFERSKSEVLRVVAEMIGTTPQALQDNAGAAA